MSDAFLDALSIALILAPCSLAALSSKALNILKWKNKWNMKKSILKTAKWYEYYLNKKDIKKITLIQIEEYFKKND